MLKALNDGYEPRAVRLEERGAILGRCPNLPAADAAVNNILRLVKINLPDGKAALNLSRDHCRIERIGNHWVLRDLGSNNGMSVNGEKVKRLASVILKDNAIIKLASARNPPFEYRFCQTEESKAGNTPLAFTNISSNHTADVAPSNQSELLQNLGLVQKDLLELRTLLESELACPTCKAPIKLAACLPCGHVFCRDCLKSPTCNICQTTARQPLKGYAAKCNVIDSIVSYCNKKFPTSSEVNRAIPSTTSAAAQVWIDIKDADDSDADENTEFIGNKKARIDISSVKEDETTAIEDMERCSYCNEKAHEDGMKCPHRDDDEEEEEEEESDLEAYV